jgi:hypothetical protein
MRIRPGVRKFFNSIHYCRKKQPKIHKGWVLFRLGLLNPYDDIIIGMQDATGKNKLTYERKLYKF